MGLRAGLDAGPETYAHADPSSCFELPCVIQGILRHGNTVRVGAFTGIYGGSIGHASIGRYCSLAPGCVISPEAHPTDWLSTSMIQYVPDIHGWAEAFGGMGSGFNAALPAFQTNQGVVIGNDVWLGQSVFVRSGVRIGDGAIVGACSVVTRDVLPFHVVAGNPARTIRLRFRQDLVDRLIALRWWDYDVFRLPNLDFTQVEQAIGLIEKARLHRLIVPIVPQTVTVAELLGG